MTVQQVIDLLSTLPDRCKSMELKADAMFGPFLTAEGMTASALIDLNFGLEAEDSDEAVSLTPLCFKVTGLVPTQSEGDDTVVLELTFERED